MTRFPGSSEKINLFGSRSAIFIWVIVDCNVLGIFTYCPFLFFAMELGQGFAFVRKQVAFQIGGTDYYTDLLFYHTRLHAYVVVELKACPFEPKDAGQLNFYVNVMNDKMKGPGDNDTIGILLCKGKNEVLAEYAHKGYNQPLSVSDYQISKSISDELKSALPDISELENELGSGM